MKKPSLRASVKNLEKRLNDVSDPTLPTIPTLQQLVFAVQEFQAAAEELQRLINKPSNRDKAHSMLRKAAKKILGEFPQYDTMFDRKEWVLVRATKDGIRKGEVMFLKSDLCMMRPFKHRQKLKDKVPGSTHEVFSVRVGIPLLIEGDKYFKEV